MHDEVLVLIDMQRCMADPGGPPRNNPGAEANIARLLAAWRGARRPVIHVRHLSLDPKSGFYPGQSGAEFQEAFSPDEGEAVADKHVTDALPARVWSAICTFARFEASSLPVCRPTIR